MLAIDSWLASQSEEDREAFLAYCRRVRRHGSKCFQYLVERGCQTSLSSVCRWLDKNIPKGQLAVEFNLEAEAYSGIEMTSALERAIVWTIKLIDKYQRIVDEDNAIPTLEAMRSMPQYLRELRGLIGQMNEIEQRESVESVALTAVARARELFIASGSVKDTPDEAWVLATWNQVMLQIKDEVK